MMIPACRFAVPCSSASSACAARSSDASASVWWKSATRSCSLRRADARCSASSASSRESSCRRTPSPIALLSAMDECVAALPPASGECQPGERAGGGRQGERGPGIQRRSS
eukprot:4440179-Prymnesium_polylepis.1